jgi:hypothetical protein
MENDLELLRNLGNRVRTELEQYIYCVPSDAVGNPMSNETVMAALDELRRAQVEPYWALVEIRDTFEQVGLESVPRRKCAVVADDRRGYFLLWDPPNDEFFLAQSLSGVLTSFGVRGDAVGCFLSR